MQHPGTILKLLRLNLAFDDITSIGSVTLFGIVVVWINCCKTVDGSKKVS
jgi:hypothetical protein